MDIASIEAQIREEDVAALDAYERGVGEAPILYRAGFLKDAKGDQVFVANEETEDRMGDVIAIDGWQLANFRRNPVLMFAHNYGIAPLGTVPRIWAEDKQLLNTVRFDEEDEFAKFIKGKYDRRVMRAESVGFRPIEFERIDNDKDTKGFFAKFRFTKQELLEISLVPVPAHPKALRKALEPYGGKFHILMPEIPEVVTTGVSVISADGANTSVDVTKDSVGYVQVIQSDLRLPTTLVKKLEEIQELIDGVLDANEDQTPDPEPAPEKGLEPEDAERLLAALRAGKNEER